MLPCAPSDHRSALITYGDKLDDGTSAHGNMRLHPDMETPAGRMVACAWKYGRMVTCAHTQRGAYTG